MADNLVKRLRETSDDWPACLVALEQEAASRIEKLEAALQAIIKRAEFRNSEYVTDVVCSIARDALEGKDE
jgi:hypothetical protein